MSLRTVGLVCVAITLFIVAWDIFLKVDEDSKTISAGSRYLARAWKWWPAMLCFTLGFVNGHFFLSDWGTNVISGAPEKNRTAHGAKEHA